LIQLPPAAEPLIDRLSIAFTRPTFKRFVLLLVGAILTPGRRTVLNVLWTVRSFMDGHVSSYHRVFSERRWSLWPLGRALAAGVLTEVPEGEAVVVAMDDHATLHKGAKVYGKGKHRDAVRSSHSLTTWLFGHKWVVLAICVKLPFASRPWALPVLCALYRTAEQDHVEGRRHKTPIQLARGLMAVLCRWFPRRTFVFLGDGGFSSHQTASFGRRHARRATMVGKLSPDANLYDPPPPRRPGQPGRPRVKGDKRPTPREAVETVEPTTTTVSWYGGSDRRVALVSDTGHWYKSGRGLVPLRWVYVRDLDGTHRDECFFSTDVGMTPEQIVHCYTARWSIEVTFQEARVHLGLHTPRNRTESSVLRTTPCLLGLFSVAALIFAELHRQGEVRLRRVPGYAKTEPTFSDALAAVRRALWEEILKGPTNPRAFDKPPPAQTIMLLECLSHAA
jgi:hypothetical protein